MRSYVETEKAIEELTSMIRSATAAGYPASQILYLAACRSALRWMLDDGSTDAQAFAQLIAEEE
jgi:hypothetical protein